MGFGNLMIGDRAHYEFQIPKKDLMKYVSANDGSPMSAVAAIMAKALYRALQLRISPQPQGMFQDDSLL